MSGDTKETVPDRLAARLRKQSGKLKAMAEDMGNPGINVLYCCQELAVIQGEILSAVLEHDLWLFERRLRPQAERPAVLPAGENPPQPVHLRPEPTPAPPRRDGRSSNQLITDLESIVEALRLECDALKTHHDALQAKTFGT